MPASTSRRALPIKPIEFATIAAFLRWSNAGWNVKNIPLTSVLILRAQRLAFRITAGRSDPRPGVTPGVAEGAKEGGRSCPLRGLLPTAGRARNAANARANVVEVQTFR